MRTTPHAAPARTPRHAALLIPLFLGVFQGASAQNLRPELELSTLAAADEPVLAAAGQNV